MDEQKSLAARLIAAIEREGEGCEELGMLIGMFGGSLLCIPDEIVKENLEKVVKIAGELLG